MQGSTSTNGQFRQVVQLQPTHPSHLSHSTSSNHGSNTAAYFLPSSNSGVGAMVGHCTMQGVATKQLSSQGRNGLLANNQLPASGHQAYYPNSTQSATFTATPTVNMNTAFRQQVMYAQNTSMSGNPQSSSMLISNLKNPTSASATQAVYTQQQTPLQSCMYSQSSHQTSDGPLTLPSYSQAIAVKKLYIASSHVPSAQNVYTVTPVTQFSCVNNSANNQSDQTNYIVSQTNTIQAAIGHTDFFTNNATSLGNSHLAGPVQTHYNSYQNQEHMKQPPVRGNRNLQTTRPVMLTTNCNASSMALPSPTCLPEKSNELLDLKNRPAPPQTITNMSTNDHPAIPSVNLSSMFYQKINAVPSLNLDAPLTGASQITRGEAFEKTVSAVQATNGAALTSPGRAQRAVAVVLPLSQEASSDDHSSPTNKQSPNTSSNSCVLSSNQTKDAQLQTPDASCLKEKLLPLTSSCNVSSENASIQSSSPILKKMLKDSESRLSLHSLTFAKLVMEGTTPQRQKKSRNRKTPTETKKCEKSLSSVPTTEWTLKKLHGKILDMETQNEKCEDKIEFLKSDWKSRVRSAFSDVVFLLTNEFKEMCAKVSLDTVILSQIKSQNDLNTRYHVLEHNEVYEEKIPYTSSWLNINSQLDDIDKEFGLPSFLKCGLKYDDCKDTDTKEGHNFRTGLKSVKSEEPTPQNDKLDQGIKPVDSKSNYIETEFQDKSIHSETDSPNDSDTNQCESNVELSDSSYSFKIEVLPPEKAKVIFEQMDCNSPQILGSSEFEAAATNDKNDAAATNDKNDATATDDQNDAKRQTCNATTLETVCCIDKWKEKVFGLASEGKCKCKELNEYKEPQSHNTDDNRWSMEFFDLTEDGCSPIVPLTGDIQEDRSPNHSAILLLSESEDESKVSEDTQTSHLNSNEQDFAKSTKDPHVASPDRNVFDTMKLLFPVSEVTVSETSCTGQEIKEQEGNCRMEKEDSGGLLTEGKQDSQQAENPTILQPVSPNDGVNEHGKNQDEDMPDPSLSHPSKKLKLSSHLRSQTIFESFSKCKNTAPIASVELALFGSRQEKSASVSYRRSYSHFFDRTMLPPERIYVKMNPLTTNDKEAESLSNMSVKRRVHENWMRSFPLSTIKIRRKNKKFAIIGNKTPLSPPKLKHKGVSSKRKVKDSDDGLCRKKRRTCSVEKSVNLLRKPDNEVKPLQENVLKFNVLPSTFSFEEGSKNGDPTTDSTADEKTIPAKAEEKPLVLKTQGVWCDESREKSPTYSPTSSPKSLGLFQEFQKQHKIRQMSTD